MISSVPIERREAAQGAELIARHLPEAAPVAARDRIQDGHVLYAPGQAPRPTRIHSVPGR